MSILAHSPLGKVSLSIPEAIRASGIGRTTIYSLIKSGQLPAKKLGRRTLILQRDLEKLLSDLPSR